MTKRLVSKVTTTGSGSMAEFLRDFPSEFESYKAEAAKQPEPQNEAVFIKPPKTGSMTFQAMQAANANGVKLKIVPRPNMQLDTGAAKPQMKASS